VTRRTIVVGVDFSPPSRKALEAAIGLARDASAGLVLVHVFAERPTGVGHGSFEGQKILQTLRRMSDRDEVVRLTTEWAEKARAEEVEVEPVACDGDPAESILQEAARRHAALIVVGTHGWGLLRRLVLGSVAARVVRQADVPVLVVPWRDE